MRWGRVVPAIDARRYAAISLLARVVWALTALYLVTVLSAGEYGRFAFAQIVTGLTSQVILGAFANIVSSRLAALDPAKRAPVLLGSIGYGAVLAGVATAIAITTDRLSITTFGTSLVLIAGLWILAGHIATVQLGYLLAGKQYGLAAAVSLLQPVLYLLLIFGRPTASGETVGLYAAVATGLPFTLLLLSLFTRGRHMAAPAGTWRAMADDHRHSMVMNLAAVPGSIALLFVANALAAQSDPTQLAVYGLANQVIGVFFFLPATVGGLAIPHLTLADTPTRRRVVRDVSLGMLLVSVTCAAGFVLVTDLPFVPQLFAQGRFEIALAFLLAGLTTARSPQVWVNQIERQSGAESMSLLANAALLATMLFMSPITAMLALVVRTAGAVASLAVSRALARQTT